MKAYKCPIGTLSLKEAVAVVILSRTGIDLLLLLLFRIPAFLYVRSSPATLSSFCVLRDFFILLFYFIFSLFFIFFYSLSLGSAPPCRAERAAYGKVLRINYSSLP